MGRPRLYDHDEAYARWKAGETIPDIAALYGVTYNAIYEVIKRRDPAAKARLNEYQRLYQRERFRKPCIRGCGRLAWHHMGRPGVCQRCSALERAESVREDALRCCECGKWLSDDSFPRRVRAVSRRGRHSVCRGCQAAVRQRFRVQARVPCSDCETPCGTAADGNKSGLCRPCWYARRRAERQATA